VKGATRGRVVVPITNPEKKRSGENGLSCRESFALSRGNNSSAEVTVISRGLDRDRRERPKSNSAEKSRRKSVVDRSFGRLVLRVPGD